jgi:hypothetical protein
MRICILESETRSPMQGQSFSKLFAGFDAFASGN